MINPAEQSSQADIPLDGKTRRLGCDRAVVLDVLRLSKRVPSFPVERWFDLREIAHARKAAETRVSWLTLFGKAYCLACQDIPELRRTYISFPWPSFYQSSYCVLSVAVNREVNSRDRLFFGRLHRLEDKPLQTIQAELDALANDDVSRVFRQQVIGSKFPSLIRRLGWWWRTVRPSQRARRIGTCSMSVLASDGVLNRQHPNMLTSSLSYGPMQGDGRMWVTLQCDHRLLDGRTAARAINLLEKHLHGSVLEELMAMQTNAIKAA